MASSTHWMLFLAPATQFVKMFPESSTVLYHQKSHITVVWWPQITYSPFVFFWPQWSNVPFPPVASNLTCLDLTLDSAPFWCWRVCTVPATLICLQIFQVIWNDNTHHINLLTVDEAELRSLCSPILSVHQQSWLDKTLQSPHKIKWINAVKWKNVACIIALYCICLCYPVLGLHSSRINMIRKLVWHSGMFWLKASFELHQNFHKKTTIKKYITYIFILCSLQTCTKSWLQY